VEVRVWGTNLPAPPPPPAAVPGQPEGDPLQVKDPKQP